MTVRIKVKPMVKVVGWAIGTYGCGWFARAALGVPDNLPWYREVTGIFFIALAASALWDMGKHLGKAIHAEWNED